MKLLETLKEENFPMLVRDKIPQSQGLIAVKEEDARALAIHQLRALETHLGEFKHMLFNPDLLDSNKERTEPLIECMLLLHHLYLSLATNNGVSAEDIKTWHNNLLTRFGDYSNIIAVAKETE